ncbi:MAG: thioredoxin [Clostridia bacterium]|nr:thioredoxin [Clostridia bacterium]
MLAVNKDNFDTEVLQSDSPVLVDFWSEGCEPCKALMPDVEALEVIYGEKIKFVKLDTTQARRLAIKERVLGLPTIAIYKDGVKTDEVVKDAATKSNVESMIQKYI